MWLLEEVVFLQLWIPRSLEFSNLEFVSDFEIRISDLLRSLVNPCTEHSYVLGS